MAPDASHDIMYRYLVQGVKDYAIYLLDERGTVINWNDGAARIKGYAAEEIVGKTYDVFFTPSERAADLPAHNLRIARDTGHFSAEGWRVRCDGSRFWAHVAIDALHDDEGRFIGFAKVTRDLSEVRNAERHLKHVANHDPLTGLANRAHFRLNLEDQAPQLLYGAPLAVHYIDLDRFKPVNDTYGHNAGDALLQELAVRLREVAHPTDIVARLGGDEFAILQVEMAKEADALALSQRVVDRLGEPFQIEGNAVRIGASVGVAVAPRHGHTADDLLQAADLALYEAKDAGRDRAVLFDPAMGERAAERRLVELKLRHAVATEGFALHFQPIVDCRTEEITGFEALLRWTDKGGRAIPPDEFIPLAERLGLMPQIGTWVLNQACREASAWPGNLTVSVNVSATQLRSTTFIDTVCSALFRAGLPAYRLELELTETAVLADIERADAILTELQALGIKVALDDFGTGFSSLSLVNRLPLSRLKIDKTFVATLDGTARTAAVVSAVTALCRGLGLSTTAEGVETVLQKEWLRREGCDNLQGYLFGRPAAQEALAVFDDRTNHRTCA
ncbi:MAG: EAL domain-containing protein [Methylobacterium mesophilicum]|nr:EAL domain-containing protein [Methylobacterium mesophilicum]